MLRLTRTAIGLLTAQYRSVLKKCWLLNIGLFALSAVFLPRDANAEFGFLNRVITGGSDWGVLNQGGYSNYFEYRSGNSGSFAMAEKPGGPDYELSIQIDGYFYQSSGRYRVLDTSDIISSVTSGSGKVVTSDAVYSALSGYATKSTTLLGYGITDAYTKTEVDNLISQAGGSSVDLSDYYTKSEVYNKTEIDDIQSLNNYYRKDKKSGILNGVKEGEIGNEIGDNFSKSVQNIKAVNDNFVSVENKAA